MRNPARIIWVWGLMACVASLATAAPRPADENEPGKITIVFKDGHRQEIPVEDIARIEFHTPASASALSGRAHFLGRWKVDDGNGRTFFITLKPDGVARKTLGSEKGTWTVVNGDAQISWDDGWHDVIRRVGSTYQKAAYEPGRALTETPSNVTPAEYTEPK